MTKKEKKLLKAAKKLEKITKRYLEELTEIDKIFQDLPTSITREFLLEERYFKFVPRIASDTVHLELLRSHIESAINFNKEAEVPSWDLEDYQQNADLNEWDKSEF